MTFIRGYQAKHCPNMGKTKTLEKVQRRRLMLAVGNSCQTRKLFRGLVSNGYGPIVKGVHTDLCLALTPSLGLSLIARARQKAVRRARSVPSQRAHNVVGCAHRSLGGKGQQKPIEVTEGRFVYTNSQALQRAKRVPETRNINAVNETNSLSQRQLAGQGWGNLINPALAAVPCRRKRVR